MGGRRSSVTARERDRGPEGTDPGPEGVVHGAGAPFVTKRKPKAPRPRPAVPPLEGARFRAVDRVKRRRDFQAIQASCRRVHTPQFVWLVAAGSSGPARLGVTVTKKIGNAVVRNRIKRVVREVFRTNRELFPEGCDVVAVARNGAEHLAYEDVKVQLLAARGALRASGEKARRTSR